MDHFEKFENQLLSSYESTLAVEGREICKEVDSTHYHSTFLSFLVVILIHSNC